MFQRLFQFHAEDSSDTKLEKLASALSQYRLAVEETAPLLAPLLSLALPDQRYPLLHLSPQRQRQKTLETIVALLQEDAERHPVLFIVEDLHWTDPTTLELLHLVIEQIPTTSILTVLTCRSHFQPVWHHRSYLMEITVNRLSPAQVEQLVARMIDGKTFPSEVLAQIVEKTDGVPLFVEEMTKAILESGQLQAVEGRYERTGSFATFAIPATLQDSLMARLDRLVTAKAVAQYAAVIGRQFSYGLLHAVAHVDAVMLQHELSRLVEADIVYQRGVPPQATYTFKHALIQDTAYQSLLRSTRQQYHQRIAQVLEMRFPALCETQPELLAHHYTEAGLAEQAMGYWQRAGQQAVARLAYEEAINHLTTGLALLETLPDTPARCQHELTLHITLGVSQIAAKGHTAPEVEKTYVRARELSRQVGETPQLFLALRGLQVFYLLRGEVQTAHELAEQLFTLAQRQPDPGLLVGSHLALGQTLFYVGELTVAHRHLNQGMVLYEQQHPPFPDWPGGHPGVQCPMYAALALWQLGHPAQALQMAQKALAFARDLLHPFSLATALNFATMFHINRREVLAAQALADELLTLSHDQVSGFLALGMCLRNWVRSTQTQGEESVTQMQQAFAELQASGTRLFGPYYRALLAEIYETRGQLEEGLATLAEAQTVMHHYGERYWQAEICRLQGVLLLRQPGTPQAEAEACFQRALDVARRQEAKSLELRTTMSLSRLWQQQGKRAEAYELLAPVYGWFTEGFDTADLQEAQTLLEELAG